jgi:diguanylate cyclase (GGDEF)-like protein
MQQEPAGTESSFDFLHFTERQKIDRFIRSGYDMALLLFEVENFSIFQELYGGLISERVIDVMENEVTSMCTEYLGECDLFYTQNIGGGKFVILFGKRDWSDVKDLSDIVLSFRLKLRSRIRLEALNLTGRNLHIIAGHSRIEPDAGDSLEQTIYKALSDAQSIARGALDASKLSLLKEFRRILAVRDLSSVYQPIVNLETGEISAWEALTRGPENSHFLSPAVLFDFAEEVDQIFTLEKVARETAIDRVGRLDSDQKLFLNIHPRTLIDPGFSPGETVKLLAGCGLKPHDVVLEITERHSIRDFALFHRTLKHYREQGFKIAVDDVGTGYSGLWSIAELKPDFLKVDMSLVRGIDTDPVKRALLETFVTFSENIGCRIIAEGIEDEKELGALMRMGVHMGQGYFLRKPSYPKPGLEMNVSSYFGGGKAANIGNRKVSTPVHVLVEKVPVVSPDDTVSAVKEIIEDGGPISSVVVVEDGRPTGLVMSHHLDRALSARYGVAVYYNRPISLIMDPQPLLAEKNTPVENVAREAMSRKKSKVFDHVIIVDQGELVGVVSVQSMLDNMAKHQVEMAKGANPLTGLPGNVIIELEIERRSGSNKPFSVIYADLDNFKVYNDSYGFKNGDNIILLLTKIMSWAAKRHGHVEEDFVGHIGGDDFVLIVHPDKAERVCKAVTRCFKRLVKTCYMPQDRNRGWMEAKSRTGEVRRFPLVSVSLAIVDCMGVCEPSELGRRAAEMKKFAKSISGNSFVRDRRSPLGIEEKRTEISDEELPFGNREI